MAILLTRAPADFQTRRCDAMPPTFVPLARPLWAPPWVMRPLSAVIPAAGPCDPIEMHSSLARTGTEFMRGERTISKLRSSLLELRAL
jgi:hypothetical protein